MKEYIPRRQRMEQARLRAEALNRELVAPAFIACPSLKTIILDVTRSAPDISRIGMVQFNEASWLWPQWNINQIDPKEEVPEYYSWLVEADLTMFEFVKVVKALRDCDYDQLSEGVLTFKREDCLVKSST